MSVHDSEITHSHLATIADATTRIAEALERKTAPTPLRGASAADLSRLLFSARERISMQVDVVEINTGQTDTWGRDMIKQIDTLRAAQGWNPAGFGGER